MKVSVVIATYNRAGTLPRSVFSVLNQTYKNLEVVIVDDGSNDDTISVLKSIQEKDERVRIIKLEKNSGASVARNRGLSEAVGDYVMVWDSDDVLYEGAIEMAIKVFNEYSEVGVVSAPCRQLLGDKQIVYTKRPQGVLTLGQVISKYVPNNEKVRIVKREFFANVRYYSRNIDFMVNGYLAKQTTWYHLSQELGDLYLESDGVSLTIDRKIFKPERSIDRVPYLIKYLKDFKDDLLIHAPYRFGALSYGLSIGLLLMDQKRNSILYAFQAIRYDWSLRHAFWFIFVLFPGSSYLFRFYTGISFKGR